MTARTARFTGLAAALTLTATALAGCGSQSDPAGDKKDDTKVSVATPRDALLKAIPDQKVSAFHFDIKGGTTPSTGTLDAPKKAFEIKIVQKEPEAGITLTMNALVLDKDAWMKLAFTPNVPGLPKLPKKWLKLDPSKVKNKDDLPMEYGDETDPGYAGLLVQNADGIKDNGGGKYAGTTDLTKSTDAEIVDDKTLTALGDKAKTVPFTAVVDGKGHLTSVILKIPAAGKAKASTYQVVYNGFGSTKSPAEPAAGEQTPATPAVYELLNG